MLSLTTNLPFRRQALHCRVSYGGESGVRRGTRSACGDVAVGEAGTDVCALLGGVRIYGGRKMIAMDDGAVLNIGARPDANAVGVTAQHAAEPDAGPGANLHIADD